MMRDIFEHFPTAKKKIWAKRLTETPICLTKNFCDAYVMDHRQILLLLSQFKELISIPTDINRKL